MRDRRMGFVSSCFGGGLVAAALIGLGLAVSAAATQIGRPGPTRGVQLSALSWPEAEKRLHADSIVVLPAGTAAHQHGPHLELGTDAVLADHLARLLLQRTDVVVAPALPYQHHPEFSGYPGSTSLSPASARDVVADVVRSLARYGPRRFYLLSVGATAAEPVTAAASLLSAEGILLQAFDWSGGLEALRRVHRLGPGAHAEEIETSMMLHLEPGRVVMERAVRELRPLAPGPLRLTREPAREGTWSPSGVWGDPTVAAAATGRRLVDDLVSAIVAEVDALRRAPIPAPRARPGERGGRGRAGPPSGREGEECLPGDDRVIRGIAPAFTRAWESHDAATIAALWMDSGDMAHPDGWVERTAQVIRENRAYLFAQREYRGSRHYLTFGTIRCVGGDVAVADGKWELRGVAKADGEPGPPAEGLFTLVLKRRPGGWGIAAWRYTVTPAAEGSPPPVSSRPRFLGPVKR